MHPRIDDLTSDRQRRLFACACCRSIWHLLLDERSRRAVEVTERYADEMAPDGELHVARAAALEVLVGSDQEQQRRRQDARAAASTRPHNHPPPLDPDALALHNGRATNPAAGAAHAAACAAADTAVEAADLALAAVFDFASDTAAAARVREAEAGNQSRFLSDIARVPVPTFTFSPSWRTDTGVLLARQMYDARNFSAMPILADALQDAGCNSADILDHCRGPGLHVRGCWVVDLVLGNE